MPAPLSHRDVGRLVGTWPSALTTSGLAIAPNALSLEATILGVVRETAAGFDVIGRSIDIWVDSQPAAITVSFTTTGSSTLTLDEVIAQINATVSPFTGSDLAYRDNGFLRLRSATSGTGSYIRLQTDPASSPMDVFANLGLFTETESFGGELQQAQHIDPDRQVASPGQLSAAHGEDLTANIINRLAMQLGSGVDRAEGFISRKRIAARKTYDVAYSDPGTGIAGVTIPDNVYCGDVATPTEDQLLDLFSILDENGNELVEEEEFASAQHTDTDFTIEVDTDKQLVTLQGGPAFSFLSTDAAGDFYVRPTNLTGGPSALNNQLLKVLEFRSATQVVVRPQDPATGTVYAISETGRTVERVEIQTLKCVVDQVQASSAAGASRVEQVAAQKVASTTVTRVELNNRIVCVGATFQTAGVIPGDVVTWSGHSETVPYSNNGTYRVTRVLDEETLEVVASNWSSAFLNIDLDPAPGTITVDTDGDFAESPFIRFKAEASGGAVPPVAKNIRVVYLGMTNLQDATDDPKVLAGSGVRYTQEASDDIQKAVLAILGPSTSSFNDYLYGDRRNNLERFNFRFNKEHYDDGGRHSDLRPDNIDMFPDVAGTNLIVRRAAADTNADKKIALRDAADVEDLLYVQANGAIGLASSANIKGAMSAPQSLVANATTYGAITGLPADTYYYVVTGIDPQGREGPASAEVSAVVGVGENSVELSWDITPGAASTYRVYRSTTSGGPYQWVKTGRHGRPALLDDGDRVYTVGDPPADPYDINIGNGFRIDRDYADVSFVPGKLSVNGSIGNTYALNAAVDESVTGIFFAHRKAGENWFNLLGDTAPWVEEVFPDTVIDVGDAIHRTQWGIYDADTDSFATLGAQFVKRASVSSADMEWTGFDSFEIEPYAWTNPLFRVSIDSPSLTLRDSNNYAIFDFVGGAAPTLHIRDTNGDTQLALITGSSIYSLSFNDSQGNPRLSLDNLGSFSLRTVSQIIFRANDTEIYGSNSSGDYFFRADSAADQLILRDGTDYRFRYEEDLLQLYDHTDRLYFEVGGGRTGGTAGFSGVRVSDTDTQTTIFEALDGETTWYAQGTSTVAARLFHGVDEDEAQLVIGRSSQFGDTAALRDNWKIVVAGDESPGIILIDEAVTNRNVGISGDGGQFRVQEIADTGSGSDRITWDLDNGTILTCDNTADFVFNAGANNSDVLFTGISNFGIGAVNASYTFNVEGSGRFTADTLCTQRFIANSGLLASGSEVIAGTYVQAGTYGAFGSQVSIGKTTAPAYALDIFVSNVVGTITPPTGTSALIEAAGDSFITFVGADADYNQGIYFGEVSDEDNGAILYTQDNTDSNRAMKLRVSNNDVVTINYQGRTTVETATTADGPLLTLIDSRAAAGNTSYLQLNVDTIYAGTRLGCEIDGPGGAGNYETTTILSVGSHDGVEDAMRIVGGSLSGEKARFRLGVGSGASIREATADSPSFQFTGSAYSFVFSNDDGAQNATRRAELVTPGYVGNDFNGTVMIASEFASASNLVKVGGGSDRSNYAATQINFYTASGVGITPGTVRLSIDAAGVFDFQDNALINASRAEVGRLLLDDFSSAPANDAGTFWLGNGYMPYVNIDGTASGHKALGRTDAVRLTDLVLTLTGTATYTVLHTFPANTYPAGTSFRITLQGAFTNGPDNDVTLSLWWDRGTGFSRSLAGDMYFGTVASGSEFVWIINGTFRATTLEVGQIGTVQADGLNLGAAGASFSTENITPSLESFLEISGYSGGSITCTIKSIVVETF